MIYNNPKKEEGQSSRNKETTLLQTILPYLRYWPLYIATLLVVIAAAWLLFLTRRTYYPIYSSILLVEDATSKSSSPSLGGVLGVLDLGISPSAVNIDNEIQILRSRNILRKAIIESGEYIDISSHDKLKKTVWFDDLPFILRMVPNEKLDLVEAPVEYQIKRLTDSTFRITDIAMGTKTDINRLPFTYTTPYGIMTFQRGSINKNIVYPEEFKLAIYSPTDRVNHYAEDALDIIKISKNASMATIRIESDNKKKGEKFLAKLIEVYNRERAIDKDETIHKQYKFINERIDVMSKELNQVEGKLEGVKKEQGVTGVQDLGVVVQSNMELKKRESNTQTELQLLNYLIDYMKKMGDENFDLIPGSVGFNDAALNVAIEGYNKLIFQRNSLSASVSTEHPTLVALNADILQARASLLEAAKVSKKGLEIQLQGLKEQASHIEGKIHEAPTYERIAANIERERSLRSQIYLMLLTKREETSMQLATSHESARIIDPPVAGNKPSAPNRIIYLLAACILGLLLPTIYIFLRSLLKTKIYTEEDIQQLSDIPILGYTPHLHKNRENDIQVLTTGNNYMTECFRSIRTNINFHLQNRRPAVLMATSSYANEGKTFITSNLAVSFSALGGKVLIIGLDIRNPQLKKAFRLKDHIPDEKMIGMTELLNDSRIDPMSVVKEISEYPNLYLITSGIIPPNPTELLSRQRLDEVLAELKRHFDYIIIDTAPCGIVVDTFIISRVVDATIYVLRCGKTRKEDLEYINFLVEENKLPNISVVLNDVKASQKKRSRRYGHYDQYGESHFKD